MINLQHWLPIVEKIDIENLNYCKVFNTYLIIMILTDHEIHYPDGTQDIAPNIQHLTTSANEEAAQVYGSNRKQQPNTGKFNTGNV